MQHRTRRIIALAVGLKLAGGIIAWKSFGASAEAGTIVVSGTVESIEADLGFQQSGRLASVAVREGAMVSPGTVLAALDQAELAAEREAAAAEVGQADALLDELVTGSRSEDIARARALLSVATNRRDMAARDLERVAELFRQALISQQEYDHRQTALDVAEGERAKAEEELKLLVAGTRPERIAQQRAARSRAAAALERIDARLEQSVVVAPFAGTVTVRHREPGEAVAAGDAILTVQDLSDRWVRLYVPGDEVGRLSLGQCAEIAADAFTDRRYAGVISHIASVAEFTPRNVQAQKDRVRLVYEVRVRITGDATIDLKPGLPADVTFAPACGAQPERN
jgi:HlyD family secretion protein